MRRSYLCALGLLVAVVFLPQAAQADGKIFPEREIAVMPAMPTQQAIIVYRDGQETLIVASSYETESQTVGWVLPLPAEPTKLAVAQGDMFDSLARGLQPKVVAKKDVAGRRDLAVKTVIFLVLPLSLIAIFVRRRRGVILAVVLLAEFLLLALMLAPTLGTKAGVDSAQAAVELLSSQLVGNYDVTIIKADQSAAVDGWLEDSGFQSLGQRGRQIVDEYIVDGWVFAVAKLRRDGDGLASPHPIAATFPSAKPIYPMKLTALAGAELHLELYVIADQVASGEPLQPIVIDKFDMTKKKSARRQDAEPQPYFVGESTDAIIGHPDVGERMWPGCVVTRLTGELSPQQMDQDISIGLSDFGEAYQRRFFSEGARRYIVHTVLAIGLAIVLVFLAAVCNQRRRPSRGGMLVVAACLLVTVIAASAVYAALPVTPTRSEGHFRSYFFAEQLYLAERAIEDGRLSAHMAEEEPAQFAELLSGDLQSWLPADGTEPMKSERSPGNFFIRRVDGEAYLCLYDEFAREYRIKLP